jgi:FkbM family methyltransferase
VKKRSLGVVEILTLVVGVSVTVGIVSHGYGRQQATRRLEPFVSITNELRSLEQKYGPSRDSIGGEEWIARDFFQDKREGVFLDVGASRYKEGSNTYYLETVLGWSGVAVEPQTKFAADYKTYRPRTMFVPVFAGSTSDATTKLYIPEKDAIASSNPTFAETGGAIANTVDTKTMRLDDILDQAGITQVDFLSMDIELAEPEALAGFTLERYGIQLACIEGHPQVRQQIIDYFTARGYTLLGKYLRADTNNLWFAPLKK